MAIKPNLNNIIPAIVIDDKLNPAMISELIKHVPKYEPNEYRRLVDDAVGAIHQIPRIFKSAKGPQYDLKNIVAYFGRSSAGSQETGLNLYNRFKAHKDTKNDNYGLVFAATTIDASLKFEKWGIHLIEILKKKKGLCISNKCSHAGGGKGKTEPAYLYMTFHYEKAALPAPILSQQQIDNAVTEIMGKYEKEPNNIKTIIHEGSQSGLMLANNVIYTGQKPIQLFQ